MSRYIDSDTLDQCREALRQGRTIDYLAGQLGCSPSHLANLLGLPSAPKPTAKADECDLWSVDRGESQL